MRAMRLALWMLRLGFAAWLIPAGINHFWPLFPQPPGNQPESRAVLEAGLALLLGWRVPLALVMLLPVSFNVWYWDVVLQGWTSISAWYGWAVLGANVLLCAAWWPSYRPLLELRHPSPSPHPEAQR
jgi:hypothetical protein